MLQNKTNFEFNHIDLATIPEDQVAFFDYMNTLFDDELTWYQIAKMLGIIPRVFNQYRLQPDDKYFVNMSDRIRLDVVFLAEEFLAKLDGEDIDLSRYYKVPKFLAVASPKALIEDVKRIGKFKEWDDLAEQIGVSTSHLYAYMSGNRKVTARVLRDILNMREDLLRAKADELSKEGKDPMKVLATISKNSRAVARATKAAEDAAAKEKAAKAKAKKAAAAVA